jgi:hypothetical protein
MKDKELRKQVEFLRECLIDIPKRYGLENLHKTNVGYSGVGTYIYIHCL